MKLKTLTPLLFILALTFAGCNGGTEDDTTAEEETPADPYEHCIDRNTPGEGQEVVVEIANCFDNAATRPKQIQVTQGALEGVAGGAVIPSKGAFKVKVSGLAGISIGKMALFMLMHGQTGHSSGGSAQPLSGNTNMKMGIWQGGGMHNVRLNRFYKGPLGHNEKNSQHRFKFYSPRTYVFDCKWNERVFGCEYWEDGQKDAGNPALHQPYFENYWHGTPPRHIYKLTYQNFLFGDRVYHESAGKDIRIHGYRFTIYK